MACALFFFKNRAGLGRVCKDEDIWARQASCFSLSVPAIYVYDTHGCKLSRFKLEVVTSTLAHTQLNATRTPSKCYYSHKPFNVARTTSRILRTCEVGDSCLP